MECAAVAAGLLVQLRAVTPLCVITYYAHNTLPIGAGGCYVMSRQVGLFCFSDSSEDE